MSGAGQEITVAIDDREVQDALKRLVKATGDLTPAMKNIGEYLVQATEQRFDSETGPDGQKWQEVSVATRARKKHPKVLTESHRLRRSIHPEADKDSVTVGTNVPYAAIHQFGFSGQVNMPAHDRLIKTAFGKELKHPVWARIEPYKLQQNLPARPFLGISEADKEEILAIIEDHIDMALK
jgi:phage virion morphogenesis protein